MGEWENSGKCRPRHVRTDICSAQRPSPKYFEIPTDREHVQRVANSSTSQDTS